MNVQANEAAYLRCSKCGHTEGDTPQSRAEFMFTCSSCGHVDVADLNAAKNLLAADLQTEESQ
jgi:putative transposase